MEKKLLRGEAFNTVACIERTGLTQLYHALRRSLFFENPDYYNPNLPDKAATPDEKAILLSEKSSHERALSRLHQLYMYSDSDLDEKEYFEEKRKLEAKLEEINKKLSELQNKEAADTSDEYFAALVSNFILENSLKEERYIDYFALQKKIDPMELKLFLNAVPSKCFIRQGRVVSIIFKNGFEHRFVYKDEEVKKHA